MDPFSILLAEDWQCLSTQQTQFTNQTVFLLSRKTVEKNNQKAENCHKCLVHIDFSTMQNIAIRSKKALPNVREYLLFDTDEKQDYIMPIVREAHFALLYFHKMTNTIYYADSLFLFKFKDKEIDNIAKELGFQNAEINHLSSPQVKKQTDSYSCGIRTVVYCEMFCKHGLNWYSGNIDVEACRRRFHRLLNSQNQKGNIDVSFQNKTRDSEELETVERKSTCVKDPSHFSSAFNRSNDSPALFKNNCRGRPKKIHNTSFHDEMATQTIELDSKDFEKATVEMPETSEINEKRRRGRPRNKIVGRPRTSDHSDDKTRSHKKNMSDITVEADTEQSTCDGVSLINKLFPDLHYKPKSLSEREEGKLLHRIKDIVHQKLQDVESSDDSLKSDTSSDKLYSPPKKAKHTNLTVKQKESLLKAYFKDSWTIDKIIERFGLSEDEKAARVEIARIREELMTGNPNRQHAQRLLVDRTEQLVKYMDEDEKLDIHENDIQRVGVEQSICFGLKNFKGSRTWITHMKKVLEFTSRHIDKRIVKPNPSKGLSIEEQEKAFRQNEVKRVRDTYPASKIFNVDQTAIQYEMTRNRTLTHRGQAKVYRSAQRLNALTHSYTVNPCISAAGEIVGKTFVTLCEPNAPKKFAEMVASFHGLYVTNSTSGFMGSNLAIEWMLKVFIPNAPSNCVLFLDSWGGFNDLKKLKEVTEKKIELIVFPKKTTGDLQPLDLSFNRQFKNFVHKLQSHIRYRAKQIEIAKRENQLKIIQLAINQFSAPRFRGLMQHGFYQLGVISHPPYFDSPDKYCFNVLATSHKLCSLCPTFAFFRCGYCDILFCVSCSLNHYH